MSITNHLEAHLIGSSRIRTHDLSIVRRTGCHLSCRASVTLISCSLDNLISEIEEIFVNGIEANNFKYLLCGIPSKDRHMSTLRGGGMRQTLMLFEDTLFNSV